MTSKTVGDVTSGSAPVSFGSGREPRLFKKPDLEDGSHDIEDAIFDKGIPLDSSSGTSGSGQLGEPGPGSAETFVSAKHRERISLMEKMMRLGKLRAFKVSHVKPSTRDKVPHMIGDKVQSDLGKTK